MTEKESTHILARLKLYICNSNIFRSAFNSFGLKVFAGAAMFSSSIILARVLGAKEFGIYSIIMAAIALCATIATLGLPSLITREVAKSYALEQWSLFKGLLLFAHRWPIIASLLLLVFVAISLSIGWPIDGLNLIVSLIAMLIVPIMALSQIRASILRGLHLVVLADIPDLLVRPLLLLVFVGGIYQTKGYAVASEAVGIQLVCCILAFLTGLCILVRQIPSKVKISKPIYQQEYWIGEGQNFFWITVVMLLNAQVGLYLSGYLSGPEQSGILQVALQLVALVVLGLSSVNLPLQGRVAEALANDNKSEAQHLVNDATTLGACISVFAALILVPFAGEIISLFGTEYTDAVNVLGVLVFSQVFNAISGSCGIVLNSAGYQLITLLGVILALIINILLSFILIPEWGAFGAAIAIASNLVVWNTFLVYWALKKTGIYTPLFGRKFFKH